MRVFDSLCREHLATGTHSGEYQGKVDGWGRTILVKILKNMSPI